MLKLALTLMIAATSAYSFAKDDFTILGVRSATPANIRIDMRVDNASDKTRPFMITPGVALIPLDARKINISENGFDLSASEGNKASIVNCTSCSLNVIHMTLDFSGSVRGQADSLINGALNFLNQVSLATGQTFIRLSFFAGNNRLFNPIDYNNYYFDVPTLKNLLQTFNCSKFTLNGNKDGVNLCNSDTATRLNTAIIHNLNALEESKQFFNKYANVTYTSIIFSDGMGRDAGVSEEVVKEKVATFKSSGGLVYAISMKSDEDNASYFKRLNPTKTYKFKKMEKFSEQLTEVFNELNNNLPVYYSLLICSAVRGGTNYLKLSSRKYNISEAGVLVDTRDFAGGCDVANLSQWKF